MSETLPEPLVPADVDLRDYVFMPLDVLRLRDSELAATPDAEAFRCSVLAWCVSWHQMPAASLPDDDTTLARLLGFGRDIRGWKKVRAAGGLRGWVKCSDGRIYHPVVAEKAIEGWAAKVAQRARTEAARKAKEEKRQRELQAQSQLLSQQQSGSVTEIATGSKGQRQEQGQGQLTPISSSLRSEEPPPRAKSITFKAWSDQTKAKGEAAISGYKAVFDYIAQVGIPQEWLQIAWFKFKDRYLRDEKAKRKRYIDWRGVFLRSVKENWFELWYAKDGGYVLTTKGQQAEREYREAA